MLEEFLEFESKTSKNSYTGGKNSIKTNPKQSKTPMRQNHGQHLSQTES